MGWMLSKLFIGSDESRFQGYVAAKIVYFVRSEAGIRWYPAYKHWMTVCQLRVIKTDTMRV